MLDQKTSTPAPRAEDGAIRADFVERVAQGIEAGDADALRELVGDLHEADLGAVLEALEPEQRPRLIALLGIDFDFTALTEVDDAVRDDILEELPPEAVAQGVRDLDSDDAVAIIGDLPKEEQAEILEQLPAPERIALARSLEYPEDSAGRRMQTEFIAAPAAWTVGRAIDYMRETEELPERFYELYVVDEAGRFLGAVPLDRSAARETPGADHRIDGARPAAACAPIKIKRKWRACSSATTGWRRRWSTATTAWSASSPSTTSPT